MLTINDFTIQSLSEGNIALTVIVPGDNTAALSQVINLIIMAWSEGLAIEVNDGDPTPLHHEPVNSA